MILILASRFDEAAVTLAHRWHGCDARLLTCDDLSDRGWVYRPGSADQSVAVCQGERIPARSIQAVLSRLTGVTEWELVRIAAEERRYVAAEMTAFLVAWLSALPCPVVNRPTPLNLSGPSWQPEKWWLEARRSGLPVAQRPSRTAPQRDTDAGATATVGPDAENITQLVCVGQEVMQIGGTPALGTSLKDAAKRLADRARAELLTLTFVQRGTELHCADVVAAVDLSMPDIADALRRRLTEPA